MHDGIEATALATTVAEDSVAPRLPLDLLELEPIAGRRAWAGGEGRWLWVAAVGGTADPFALPYVQRLLVSAQALAAQGVVAWLVSGAPVETLRRGVAKFTPRLEVRRDERGSLLAKLSPWLAVAPAPAVLGATVLVDRHGQVLATQRDTATGPWLRAADVLALLGARMA